ncbi:MAG: TatD family hydrolase [Sphaerochaetaceae bacterium]|nr:TatD family hydrolase [Sphaerochaetaceae bacterium]
MFDFHNHFTDKSAILCPADLLPKYYTEQRWEELKRLMPKHLGEAGLDKRFFNTVSLEEQKRRLTEILVFAKENSLCVTLHCVQCTSHMLEVLSSVKPRFGTVIWHGFTGSAETAAILYKMGVIISVGPRLSPDKIKEVLSANSLFVVETDYEGSSEIEHKQRLEDVYNKVAAALGKSVSEIEEMCFETAAAFTT